MNRLRFLIAAATIAGLAWPSYAEEPTIEGPDRVAVHRLVELTAGEAADGFAWIIREDARGSRPDSVIVDGGRRVIWTGPVGTYSVDLIVSEGGKLSQTFRRIVIGESPEPDPEPDPDPEPGPDPDVPDDEFDSIGRRVSEWTAELPSRGEVRQLYQAAAESLRGDPSKTIGDVAADLTEGIRSAVDVAAWADVIERLNEDLSDRWPMQRVVLADYYEAVSQGLQ